MSRNEPAQRLPANEGRNRRLTLQDFIGKFCCILYLRALSCQLQPSCVCGKSRIMSCRLWYIVWLLCEGTADMTA